MKRFIRTDNDRFIKLEGLMYVSSIQETYPRELTPNTKFDEDGKPLPLFFFEMVYNGEKNISPVYEDIDEAYQDRENILNALNES